MAAIFQRQCTPTIQMLACGSARIARRLEAVGFGISKIAEAAENAADSSLITRLFTGSSASAFHNCTHGVLSVREDAAHYP